MKRLGYSQGYLYPHNYPGAWVEQEYLPEKIRDRIFYIPTDRGWEREVKKRLAALRDRKGKKKIPPD